MSIKLNVPSGAMDSVLAHSTVYFGFNFHKKIH